MSVLDTLNRSVWTFRNKFSPLPDYDFDNDGEIICNYTPITWSREAYIQLMASGVIGGLVGVFIAFILNGAFVELSLSSAFSVYFGILFILLGVVILRRAWSAENAAVLYPDEVVASRGPRRQLISFSILNILTGVACILFDFDSVMLFSVWFRVIVYTLLGMSLSFGLTYGIVDILNLIVGFLRPGSSRPLVESILQIYVVVLTSLCMGATFGFVFGIADIEDHLLTMISEPTKYALQTDIHLATLVNVPICLSLGGIWGSVTGLANEYIRRVELAFNRLDQPVEFEGDI